MLATNKPNTTRIKCNNMIHIHTRDHITQIRKKREQKKRKRNKANPLNNVEPYREGENSKKSVKRQKK